MNKRPSILLYFAFFIALVALPVSQVSACGSSKTCCKMLDKKGTKSKCCCNKKWQEENPCHNNKKEEGNCNSQGCPCNQNITNFQMGNISSQLDFSFSAYFLADKTAWYYIQEFPTMIYLSIWLKPKISCTNIV